MANNNSEAPPARPIRARATELRGSNAGAGSGTLSVYRKHRRVELERLSAIEKEQEIESKAIKAQEILNQNAAQDEARVEKNRRKRARKKGKKGDGNGTQLGGSNSDQEGDQADFDLEEEAKALLEMAETELSQTERIEDQKVSNIETA